LWVVSGRAAGAGSAWGAALWGSPQRFFYNQARRSDHSRVLNLLASDQTTVDSLRDSLADEVSLDRAGFDQVENRPQRASELESLRRCYVAVGQVGLFRTRTPGISLLRRKVFGTVMWIFAGFRSHRL
jgi:hypothetical protein